MEHFVVMMAVIAVFIAVVVAIVMAAIAFGKKLELQAMDPEKVLANLYANGELSEPEYARRLSVLRLGPPLELPDFT